MDLEKKFIIILDYEKFALFNSNYFLSIGWNDFFPWDD